MVGIDIIIIAFLNFLVALMHSTVHGKTMSCGFKNVTRPGHCSGGPGKCNLHKNAPDKRYEKSACPDSGWTNSTLCPL